MNKQVLEVTPDTMDLLVRYDWPGNVREIGEPLSSVQWCLRNLQRFVRTTCRFSLE